MTKEDRELAKQIAKQEVELISANVDTVRSKENGTN